jgi:inorganic pyrophosphatase
MAGGCGPTDRERAVTVGSMPDLEKLPVGTDGEPMDVIVAAYDGAFPGCVVRARPIGLLEIEDASGVEPNVLAVPDDDPRFADIRELDDLPEQNLHEIEQFFVAYKELEGDDSVEIRGWVGAEQARTRIRERLVDPVR